MFRITSWFTFALLFSSAVVQHLKAGPATLLFNEEFGTISGWTVVKPQYYSYVGTAVAWGYDQESDALFENSNIYTDAATTSPSRVAVMLINDTVPPTSGYEYKVRLTMPDDDGCGLIFGYQNETNFYRLEFSWQNSSYRQTGWPFLGWNLDRMANGSPTDLAGRSMGPVTFTPVQNVPFDVTVAVTNDHVWVTVDGTALVTDQALPTTPSGKVGLFSWGMSSSALVPGFSAQNRSLSPTPLTETNNWQNLITPNATGTGWGTTPILARVTDGNGNGFLRHKSDTGVENDTVHRVDFRTSAYVAGDTGWSNYVMHSRVLLTDDDGWGIYVRYLDSTNFVRVAFRVQTGTVTTGVKVGTSVQKCTNMVFSELFLSAGTANAPAVSSVCDLYAVVQTNSLMLHLVQNQDGVSSTFTKGPIAMNNQATGKIGLWGWYQSYNDWDFVRVYEITNTPFFVSSLYSPVEPPAGMNDLPLGGTVNAYAPDVVDAPRQKRTATGWRRTYEAGNAVSGSGSNVTFTLNQVSTLRWDWQTQYELTVSATPGGTVNFLGSQYLPSGTATNLFATPSAGYVFMGWSGLPSASFNTNLTATMSQPITLVARFAADSDGDGLADDWEITNFGNLSQGAAGDPDGDSRSNFAEFRLGTNPNAAETLMASDGLSSRWFNPSRDRAIPGWLTVTNHGAGFRGLFDDSNHGLGANNPGVSGAGIISATSYATNASFQGPILVVRSDPAYWNDDWLTNFVLTAEYSVGDNDGSCIYFRYLNESNYYRVTLDGQATGGSFVNPVQGVSVQMRTNGYWSLITPTSYTTPGLFPDEGDINGPKKVRVTIGATNDTFEVRVIRWNTTLLPPDWDTNFEAVLTFADTNLTRGTIGVGDYAMGAGATADNSTAANPVNRGWYADNITVTNNGTQVFSEDWETARLSTDFPAGWNNVYAAAVGLSGDWRITADGTIGQLSSAFGTPDIGNPMFDGQGPVLLAPGLTNANYLLELGIIPYDDGGMGFVYDYVDTANFYRVLFDSQIPLAGELPQGLNISRKSGGVWSDIVIGDPSFVYTPGRAFDLRFSHRTDGSYYMSVSYKDDPATVYNWQWTNAPSASTNYGLAVWNMPDAHYSYVRAYNVAAVVPPATPFKITNITLSGGNVILDISKPSGSSYHVLRATDVAGPYATNAASQSASQYTEPAPTGSSTYYYRLQLLQ